MSQLSSPDQPAPTQATRPHPPVIPMVPLVQASSCPVCVGPLETSSQWECPACSVPLHKACREFIGGCSRYACSEAIATRRGLRRYLETRTASQLWWGGGLLALGLIGSWSVSVFVPAAQGSWAWVLGVLMVCPLISVVRFLRHFLALRRKPRDEQLVNLLRRYHMPPARRAEHTGLQGLWAGYCSLGMTAGISAALFATPFLLMKSSPAIAHQLLPWVSLPYALLMACTWLLFTLASSAAGALAGVFCWCVYEFVRAIFYLNMARSTVEWERLGMRWEDEIEELRLSVERAESERQRSLAIG